MRTKLEILGTGAILFIIIAAGYIVYDHFADRPVGSESTIAKVAPAVARQPTSTAVIKAPVKTYVGKTKANLKLPAAVQADDRQQVIAASQVKNELRPQTVSTVVNTETGEVQTFVKTDPYPWFAVETRGELKLAYGYKYNHVMHDSAPVARLQVGYDVVRIKAFTVGVTATVDSDSTAFAGVGLTYRW